ncbi:MAG: patatin-like protein [Gammaproteobacteria bacterium]|nr:patatin-like protein [Gammaproteobacteria bacterium]
MAKKELRLAVVIYGGASLAVYMHGVTKELLKLVRASKVLHEADGQRPADGGYGDGSDDRAFDTEAVYFDLLREINGRDHFRVVIDVIAGASAGAINGVMLAKALVDDARLDAQTEGWMAEADVEKLAAKETRPWHKWYLYPFLRALSWWLPRDIGADAETRGKLTRLVRSAWFRPPFSGERLCNHFFDALEALAATRRAGSSLLPPGQRLDVYASLTDLLGYPRTIRLHDGLVAREQAHAAICQLSHVATDSGSATSDFADGNEAALVWAARASSSYAGAFPPFHHGEMQRVLAGRGLKWPGEQDFLRNSLRVGDGSPAHHHFDPADRYFVDGGIVNNKPFRSALQALNHRAADRRVKRCITFIEPDPNVAVDQAEGPSLGYLSTIRAALSSIPRNQPILDDLGEVVAQDARVQVNRRIIEANRADIERMVAEMRAVHARQPLTADLVSYLRAAMLHQAEVSMGLAYHVYIQRRIWRLVDALVQSWSELADEPAEPRLRRAMEQSLAGWWQHAADESAISAEQSAARLENRQEAFLQRFDVTFRIRRLQFLIRRLNQHEGDRALSESARDALDGFKQCAYEFMERCYRLRRSEDIDEDLVARLVAACGRVPLADDEAFSLLEGLADSLSLQTLDRELDEAFFEFHQRLDNETLREGVLGDYMGFPVYDVLLLAPGSLEGGPDPLTPVRVERISPEDAPSLAARFGGLRCREFMGFLGFFNRAYREHDYLWGRLNGAERVVDLLVDAAEGSIADADALKRRLFRTIIDTERSRLDRCQGELDDLAQHLDELEAQSSSA